MMKCPNFIPSHIGESFTVELVDLVDRLSHSHGFKGRYLKSQLLSKYCDTSTTPPDVRKASAINKWLLAEDANRKTNRRIPLGVDFGWSTSDDVLNQARQIVASVLGPIERLDGIRSYHTNGASTRIRRSSAAAIQKHSGIADATPNAMYQWSLGVKDTILEDQQVQSVPGSQVFTVPKKSDIDRVACKEPEINLFLQRAVGSYIRMRLKRAPHSLDLNDQTVNQELARIAVKNGLATVDLSSASDSISMQLVISLLPEDWSRYLVDIRSPYTVVDGCEHQLEMFSSMGNGFTFELESLIFWALTRAVCRLSGVKGTIKVYGDDIVAPSRVIPRLERVFHWFGFKVNPEKTFYKGRFRESCGKHYYNSWDVSPFFIREPVRSKTSMIRLLNRLMEWDSRDCGFITDEDIYDFHRKWSDSVPKRLWGGQDPDDITSLVTGHPPRSRLMQAKIEESFEADSAIIHWHTVRRVSSVLELDVVREGRWFISHQPSHLVRSTYTPWLAYTETVHC